MVNGAHLLLYSAKPEQDRAFFRDVLRFKSVDAGHGWLIFRLPPAELALHPEDAGDQTTATPSAMRADLYLMCADLAATVKRLEAKKVPCGPVARERWGLRTTAQLPSGGRIGLYQPSHPTALRLSATKKKKKAA